jgi:hypothetical protein
MSWAFADHKFLYIAGGLVAGYVGLRLVAGAAASGAASAADQSQTQPILFTPTGSAVVGAPADSSQGTLGAINGLDINGLISAQKDVALAQITATQQTNSQAADVANNSLLEATKQATIQAATATNQMAALTQITSLQTLAEKLTGGVGTSSLNVGGIGTPNLAVQVTNPSPPPAPAAPAYSQTFVAAWKQVFGYAPTQQQYDVSTAGAASKYLTAPASTVANFLKAHKTEILQSKGWWSGVANTGTRIAA